ncbi:MAG: alpha/beta fold hydrolase [Planctomycetota bacterium]|jgi:pimeloyl-ACP methyl ester carboxylesterase
MRGALGLLVIGPLLAAGCDGNGRYLAQERLDKGLVIILPGIEGVSSHNLDVRRGLVMAEVDRALPIHSWGRPVPVAGMLLNQMDIIGNRLAAARIAKMIVNYQDSHPDNPVHIIGHSGGGGIAVFAAEELPSERKVDGLILLSASISSGYDLTKALSRCRNGIVNFYTRADVGLLMIGTSIAGNVDGARGPAAGAIGFETPDASAEAEKKAAYQSLFQVELPEELVGSSAHTAATRPSFVWTYVAPWVTSATWAPPGYAAEMAAEAKAVSREVAAAER